MFEGTKLLWHVWMDWCVALSLCAHSYRDTVAVICRPDETIDIRTDGGDPR